MQKQCSKCKNHFSLNNFSKDRTKKDGLMCWCKNCCAKKDRIWNKNKRDWNSKDSKYQSYKKGAKRRGYDFLLTKEEFLKLWQKDCYYCGSKIKFIGIDRVDNNIGYTVDNIVPCCSTCNRLKKTLSKKNYLEHVKRIYNHSILKSDISAT